MVTPEQRLTAIEAAIAANRNLVVLPDGRTEQFSSMSELIVELCRLRAQRREAGR